jgi:hypothetical protein
VVDITQQTDAGRSDWKVSGMSNAWQNYWASYGSGIEAGVSTPYLSFRYLAGGVPTSRLKALRKATPDS